MDQDHDSRAKPDDWNRLFRVHHERYGRTRGGAATDFDVVISLREEAVAVRARMFPAGDGRIVLRSCDDGTFVEWAPRKAGNASVDFVDAKGVPYAGCTVAGTYNGGRLFDRQPGVIEHLRVHGLRWYESTREVLGRFGELEAMVAK